MIISFSSFTLCLFVPWGGGLEGSCNCFFVVFLCLFSYSWVLLDPPGLYDDNHCSIYVSIREDCWVLINPYPLRMCYILGIFNNLDHYWNLQFVVTVSQKPAHSCCCSCCSTIWSSFQYSNWPGREIFFFLGFCPISLMFVGIFVKTNVHHIQLVMLPVLLALMGIMGIPDYRACLIFMIC